MRRPLAVDLCSGLGGWAEGLEAEGWDVIRVDIEDMFAATGTPKPSPCLLMLQDIQTIHGSQFKGADLICASPPCQFFSYTAMPWTLAKERAARTRADPELLAKELALFEACFRIQREASEAKGEHVPMVVENVKGAQPWVGRARWAFGSYYLWGDVPALMPSTATYGAGPAVKRSGRTMCFPEGSANPDAVRGRRGKLHWQDEGTKIAGMNWSNFGKPDYVAVAFNDTRHAEHNDGRKVPGFRFDGSGRSFQTAAVNDGEKHRDIDGYERDHPQAFGWKKPRTSSGSSARKAASARIAKIPEALSRHIARCYRP